MINKELIELQRKCKATCVLIQNDDCKNLDSKVIINANSSNYELLTTFKEEISKKQNLNYFIITGIDELNTDMQNKYYQIVKDREFNGYKLPKDLIVVFTVKDKNGLKKISQELYHFCVVAI